MASPTSALLLDDALKPATPLTIGAMKRCDRFASLSDDRPLQLVDCRESLTLIGHLLKGTPNSLNDLIQVQAVWEPHVRLDERDILTPSLIAPLVNGLSGLSSSKADTLNV